jgi:hypothetical protein
MGLGMIGGRGVWLWFKRGFGIEDDEVFVFNGFSLFLNQNKINTFLSSHHPHSSFHPLLITNHSIFSSDLTSLETIPVRRYPST